MSPRRPGISRPRAVAGRVDKSLPPALLDGSANGRVTQVDMAQLELLRLQAQAAAGQFIGLPRQDFSGQFGPNVPLVPSALDAGRADDGRPEPRFSEYPVSWNLPGAGSRVVPWTLLRRAAEMPVIADCLRIRKQEISTLDWEIGISKAAVTQVQRAQGTNRVSAESQLREQLMPQIARLTTWWEEPDRGQGEVFPQWITKLLDERMTLDAVSIYPRWTYGGELYAFEILDGSTIKPLLDDRGGRPIAPQPAYQQILYGFPRGEYRADIGDSGDGVIPGGFRADQLIYLRREVRSFTPYGRSNVELALIDLDTWMRRLGWLRAEYTDGAVPTGWLVNKNVQAGNTSAIWTPTQVVEYETVLNDLLSGDSAARHRIRVPPPGWEPVISPDNAEKYRPDYDLFLLKLLVSHMDTTIHELGFPENKGLGGAGHAQGQERLQERKGSTPTLKDVQAILTRLSRVHLDMPVELEFRWLDIDEDQDQDDERVRNDVAGALLTLNEGRDERGQARYDFPEADMPMIMGPTGVTFVEGALKRTEDAQTAAQAALAAPPGGAAPASGPRAAPPGGASGTQSPARGAQADEAKAYRRWARGPVTQRKFVLNQLWTPDELDEHGIDAARVSFTAKGGDASPKAPSGPSEQRVAAWPAWRYDQQAAVFWSLVLASAVTAGVGAVALATAWLGSTAERGHGSFAPSAAASFLHLHGLDVASIARRLRPVLDDVARDGAQLGRASATQLVTGQPAHELAGWVPGLAPYDEVAALLTDPQVRAIAVNRHQVLADALHDAAQRGGTAQELADELGTVLDDQPWGRLTAQTEITRSSADAATAVYVARGIPVRTWLTANDTKVCPICIENEQAGPVPTGEPFPTGHLDPPAHPHCRCTTLPSTVRVGPEQLGHRPDYQRKPGEHRSPRAREAKR